MTATTIDSFGLELGVEELDEAVELGWVEFGVGVVVGAAAGYGAFALGVALAT